MKHSSTRKADGSQDLIHHSAKTWKDASDKMRITIETNKEISSIKIDWTKVPNANRKNNIFGIRKEISGIISPNIVPHLFSFL